MRRIYLGKHKQCNLKPRSTIADTSSVRLEVAYTNLMFFNLLAKLHEICLWIILAWMVEASLQKLFHFLTTVLPGEQEQFSEYACLYMGFIYLKNGHKLRSQVLPW
jgi:hypothetical protein